MPPLPPKTLTRDPTKPSGRHPTLTSRFLSENFPSYATRPVQSAAEHNLELLTVRFVPITRSAWERCRARGGPGGGICVGNVNLNRQVYTSSNVCDSTPEPMTTFCTEPARSHCHNPPQLKTCPDVQEILSEPSLASKRGASTGVGPYPRPPPPSPFE